MTFFGFHKCEMLLKIGSSWKEYWQENHYLSLFPELYSHFHLPLREHFFGHATDHKHSQLWHRTNITLLALKKLWINAVNHTRHPKSHNACCFCKVLQTKMCLKEFYNYHIPAIQKDLKNLINYQPHTINA